MEKVAFVTGASSGIGRATAALLAGSDYRVFGASRNIAGVKPIPNVEFLQLDVRDDESDEADQPRRRDRRRGNQRRTGVHTP